MSTLSFELKEIAQKLIVNCAFFLIAVVVALLDFRFLNVSSNFKHMVILILLSTAVPGLIVCIQRLRKLGDKHE